MKTLVVTHVYEQALPYLSDLFKSISCQSDMEFELVVFNYGLSEPLSQHGFFGVEVGNKWGYEIPDARDWAMRYAVENCYDLAIFIDADDTMSPDRVKQSKLCHLTNKDAYGFYYTGLYFMDDPEKDFFSGDLPKCIESFKTIKSSNCVGLSNFAINVSACKNVVNKLKTPKSVIAYDWYFASILLMNNVRGCLVDAKTYYRIYRQNTAGETSTLNLKTIRRTIEVKQAHFSALLDYYNNESIINKELYLLFSNNVKKYDELTKVFQCVNNVNQIELSSQLKLSKNTYWWGII